MKQLLAILLLTLTASAQGLLINPYSVISPCFTTANTAVFGGSPDQLERSASGLTGMADSKVFTLSFWMKQAALSPGGECIFDLVSGGINQRFVVTFTAAAKIRIDAYNAASGQILQVTSASTVGDTSWHHFMVCVDLANSSNRKFYWDGAADAAAWGTYTDDTIDFAPASPTTAIGISYPTSTLVLIGDLAEFWLDDVYNDAISDYYCTGRPANLGATGNTPTGSAPALYLSRSGDGNGWAVDSSGNGNTFTVFGSLGTTTSP